MGTTTHYTRAMRRPVVFSSDSLNTCFGCGSENPLGLRLLFFETDAGVECEWTAPPHVAGPPGIVHGGIQGTVLDEVLCMAAFAKHATPVVTGELTVRYRRPAPTGVPLLVRGRIVEIAGNASEWSPSPDRATRATGQFDIADERSAGEIAQLLRRLGYEPVWKDWDTALTA